MKKVLCFLLALMILTAFSGVALAKSVSASYKDGKLTVSSDGDDWYRIIVDGVGTQRSVTPKVPTFTFDYELADGEHVVTIASDIVGSATTRITIVNGVSVDASATAAPEPAATEIPAHEHHYPQTEPGVEPTCTKTGLTGRVVCLVGEVLEEPKTIPALGHRYVIVERTETSITYQCVRCGEKLKAGVKEAVADRFGNIVLNGEGEVMYYQAAAAKNDAKTIALTLKKSAQQITLSLDSTLIAQIIREGYTKVEVINGKMNAEVDLYKISTKWFEAGQAIETYLFTFATDAEPVVEALAGGEKLAALTFDGVTVK